MALEFAADTGHRHGRILGPPVPFLLCLLDGRAEVNIQRMKSPGPLDSKLPQWAEVITQNKMFNQNITHMVISINTETGTSGVLILGALCLYKKIWVICEEMYFRVKKTFWKFRVLSPDWKKKVKMLHGTLFETKRLHFFL